MRESSTGGFRWSGPRGVALAAMALVTSLGCSSVSFELDVLEQVLPSAAPRRPTPAPSEPLQLLAAGATEGNVRDKSVPEVVLVGGYASPWQEKT